MADDVTLDTKGLDGLIKALKGQLPSIRIGILGASTNRAGGTTNATVGAAHEYGTITLPQRSFLRKPLIDLLDKEMESSGAFSAESMNQVMREKSIEPWLKKVAQVALKIVQGGFASGGYGDWAPWKNPNYKNNTGQVLVDTQQLRNSITTEIK